MWQCAACSCELCRADTAVGRRWVPLTSSITGSVVTRVRSCPCTRGREEAAPWRVRRIHRWCPLLEAKPRSADPCKSIPCLLGVIHGLETEASPWGTVVGYQKNEVCCPIPCDKYQMLQKNAWHQCDDTRCREVSFLLWVVCRPKNVMFEVYMSCCNLPVAF